MSTSVMDAACNVDWIAMYNCCFRGLAIGTIGSALVLKTLMVRATVTGPRSRKALASLAVNGAWAVSGIWVPVGLVLWAWVEAWGGWLEWCGWGPLFSAVVGSGFDVLILRRGFGATRSVGLFGLSLLANVASLLFGAGLATYEWSTYSDADLGRA